MLFLENNQYVGVAPVPLAQYVAYLEAYRNAVPRSITRARVREAFSHLVLSDRVLDQVGPAIGAAHSMFVYGPPGNGKTVIAQAIRGLLDGEMAVPHALEVEGNIIRLFDPVNHEPLETPRSSDDEPVARGRSRSALGPLQASDGHGRRRVDAGVARALLLEDDRASTPRRFRPSPTAACWSSTTSAGSGVRRATC